MADREPPTAGNLIPQRACWHLVCALGLAVLGACGGGSGGSTSGSGSSVTVSGSVSGVLEPGLVLQLNGGSDLSLDVDRTFTFDAAVPSGSAFEVTIAQHPPSQRCELVNRDSGVAGAQAVLDVGVACGAVTQPTVRGIVKGLTQPGLLLTQTSGLGAGNNKELRFDQDGFFEFTGPVDNGMPYALEVRPPPSLVCDIFGAASGIVAKSPLATVECTPPPPAGTARRRLGGKVQGLVTPDAAITLRLNGRIAALIGAAGSFTFSEPLPTGSRYEVSVLQTPVGVTCDLARSAGVVGQADITDIDVNCHATPPTRLIRGKINGLRGSGLKLVQENTDMAVTVPPGATGFTFAVPPDEQFVRLTVATQPKAPAQVCDFTDVPVSGFLVGDAPTDVTLTCSNLPAPPSGGGFSLNRSVLTFNAHPGGITPKQFVYALPNERGETVDELQVSADLSRIGFDVTIDLTRGEATRISVTPPQSTDLAPGTYTGTITITACGAATCSPHVIPVTYTVHPLPVTRTLELSEHGVALTASVEGSQLTRSLKVRDTGTSAAGWRAATNAPWLTVTPGGDSGGTLQIVADPGGLPDGQHQALITVRSIDPSLPQEDHVQVGLFKTGVPRVTQLSAETLRGNSLRLADPIRPLFYGFAGNTLMATHAYTGQITARLSLSPDPGVRSSVSTAATTSDGSRLYVFTVGDNPFRPLEMTTVDLQSWKILRTVRIPDVFNTGDVSIEAVAAVVGGRSVVVLGGISADIQRQTVIVDGDSGAVLGQLQLPDTTLPLVFASRDPKSVYVLNLFGTRSNPSGISQLDLHTNAVGNVLGEKVGALLAMGEDALPIAVSPDGLRLAAYGATADDGPGIREFAVEAGQFRVSRVITEQDFSSPESRGFPTLGYDAAGRLVIRFDSSRSGSVPVIDLFNLDGTLAKRFVLPSTARVGPRMLVTSDGLLLLADDQLLSLPPP